MATLVQRLRATLSIEEDDFFDDDTLLSYLNSSQHRIVGGLVGLETRTQKTLRALDLLRKPTDLTSTTSTELVSGVYTHEITPPSDFLQHINLLFDKKIPVREITPNKVNHIFTGNATPTTNEIFFVPARYDGTLKYRIYTYNQNVGTYTLFYYSKPTSVSLQSTELTSLPKQLENAVIYGAAEMVLLQESPRDATIGQSLEVIRAIYATELQGGTF